VTVLAFGAHWCGPCRASYPSVIRMANTFKGHPVQFVLATNTYGYFEEHAALTPQQEVAYDTGYFFGEHHLPVTLAISAPDTHEDTEGRVVAAMTGNDQAYQVRAIPQTVVIDKQGIVRAILVGWSPANEGRITTLLRDLL
jgi:thiol-disulfide isomerase/thioredoxin